MLCWKMPGCLKTCLLAGAITHYMNQQRQVSTRGSRPSLWVHHGRCSAGRWHRNGSSWHKLIFFQVLRCHFRSSRGRFCQNSTVPFFHYYSHLPTVFTNTRQDNASDHLPCGELLFNRKTNQNTTNLVISASYRGLWYTNDIVEEMTCYKKKILLGSPKFSCQIFISLSNIMRKNTLLRVHTRFSPG